MTPGRSLPSQAARVALAALALTAGTALLIRAVGASFHARQLLGFRFDPPAQRPDEAVKLAATNLRLIAAPLLAALVVRTRPRLRRPLDATLIALLALNTGALGLALGAYGSRLADAVALHALLELAAFSIAGGTYVTARRGDLTVSAQTAVAVVAVTLVVAGAVVETYVQIGGGQ